MKKRISLGRTGEQIAQETLVRHGYRIIETNYKAPLGEIDIIAEENGELVFIEVKTRSSEAFGTPAEAVTTRKQQQIIRVAEFYLAKEKCFDLPSRFDVVSILFEDDGKPTVEIIENAFEES